MRIPGKLFMPSGYEQATMQLSILCDSAWGDHHDFEPSISHQEA